MKFIVVAANVAAAYSFIDEKTGKKVEGVTKYACIQRTDDNLNPVAVFLCKQCKAAVIVDGTVYDLLYYDRFGHLAGGVESQR